MATRIAQLDGLRALAIAGVMLFHSEFAFLERTVPLWLGVHLFFVLSGFLITGILLRGERSAEFVGGFYIRRALRLFPLYYLVFAIMALFSQELREAWPYYTFYSANIWIFKNMRWGAGGHFWTLSVEEQFYLLWPFVVLFTPRRGLVGACIAMVIVAPLFRAVVSSSPVNLRRCCCRARSMRSPAVP